ncbi:MAG: hypothetical protein EP335_09380 [Alphaproteobacteria bacterium]|nr:MAG: hypothetical protein EP335_09380 [Alphaproteobacteria bacterium]
MQKRQHRQPLSAARMQKRPRGRRYLFDLQAGLPDLPPFTGMLDLYERKRGQNAVMKRSELDFRDLRGWHGLFALYEFDAALDGGYCRLMGEEYRGFFGDAMKQGMRFMDVEDTVRADLLHYLRGLLRAPAAGYFTGHMSYRGREHVAVSVLDLPAADAEGRVRYLLSFVASALFA